MPVLVSFKILVLAGSGENVKDKYISQLETMGVAAMPNGQGGIHPTLTIECAVLMPTWKR